MRADSDQGREWMRLFGEAVRRRRADLALSQAALAQAAGVSLPYISQVEHGTRNISLVNIRAFAEALECSPAVFFED